MIVGADLPDLMAEVLWPALTTERERLDVIDRWWRWEHDRPHSPRASTTEYRELVWRSETPWLGFVVAAVVQQLYVDGYRAPRAADNAPTWQLWQANGFDNRQVAVHEAALAYGSAYVTVLPGEAVDGSPFPVLRGKSPRRLIALYEDPAADEWPAVAAQIDPAVFSDEDDAVVLTVFDEASIYRSAPTTPDAISAGEIQIADVTDHKAGVCPVVRFADHMDLEGRTPGEVEPFIPLAARIDQTTFDRLVVQRFSSWVVRTIAGMARPDSGQDAELEKLRLKVEDILVAEDADTKFGSLPATPLDGFISARDADIRDLAAVTQTPPHYLLGQVVNISADALAAAEAALTRKIEQRKHTFGESWEQMLRLGAALDGDLDAAADTEAQVRWRDMESRSLAQTADALGKLAQMLNVPAEMLWENIPGWTDQDVERAKMLTEAGASMESLMAEIATAVQPAQPPPAETPTMQVPTVEAPTP